MVLDIVKNDRSSEQDTASIAAGAGKDGRRKRSARSREKIIDALFTLVRAGHIEASAQRVADEAGISSRTVFRHFEEVDLIYREMTSRIEDEVMPIVLAPFKSSDWRGRLVELVERRAKIYEHIMLLKLAGWIRRFGSATLMESHNRFVTNERNILASVLPETRPRERARFHALDTALSFEAWRRYRQDCKLSVEDAQNAMLESMALLTKGLG